MILSNSLLPPRLKISTGNLEPTICGINTNPTTFRPSSARYENIITSLNGEDAKTRLQELENELRLVQIVGPAKDQVRFMLDTLAEYLAAIYMVEQFANNVKLWQEFLQHANEVSGSTKPIRGFLAAVS